MSAQRRQLPHQSDRLFMTDGGLETTLIFQDGIDLPAFAAFDLMKSEEGMQRLREYYRRYVVMAHALGLGIVLEAPTWRANADWATQLGYDEVSLARVNRRSIGMLATLRQAYETAGTPIVLSGCLGPRGDGYRVYGRMTAAQARDYHAVQIDTFAGTEADMMAAFTMNYVDEALGIVLAARGAQMPVAISFTVETDGRLPSGDTLQEAIERTDRETDGYPAYYMINCAHPTHFHHVLSDERHPGDSQDSATTSRHPGDSRDPELPGWRMRIAGIRANASTRSHAELDESTELDDGDPVELGRQYVALRGLLPRLTVVGGCCGTDHRHVESICRAMSDVAAPVSIPIASSSGADALRGGTRLPAG
ncbi:MAG: homocysteine S-methyltransferase family protein [Burkholderiales bacterium]|nr:homocysteine S-methyltransferase family protein [Burkholderiales bacterium]